MEYNCVVYSLTITKNIQLENISIKTMIEGILNSEFMPVYGFFLPLSIVYLSIPVLSSIDERNRRSIMKYLMTCGITLNNVLPLIFKLIGLQWNEVLFFGMTGGYVIYAIIGHYINSYTISKKTQLAIYISGLLGLLVQIIGTHIVSANTGETATILKDYTNITTMAYTAAIFCFFKSQEHSHWMNVVTKVVSKISDTTFGIYLVHIYLLTLFTKFLGEFIGQGILYDFIITALVFFGSIILVKILKKIPVVRNIVP